MKARFFPLLLLLPLLAPAANPPTPAPEPPRPDDFKTYRTIRVRNIFDPNRRGDPVIDGTAPKVAPPTTSNGRPQFLALTGVLIQPEKPVGFFSGSRSDHSGVFPVGTDVAGYRLRALSITGAEMEREGQKVMLPVGSQIMLDGASAGSVQAIAGDLAPSPSSFSPSPSSSNSSNPSPNSTHSSVPENDVVKRMKERRKKEMK